MTLPADAETLVPHRLPMRLIDQITEYDGQSGTGRVRPGALFAVDETGRIDRALLIEMAAQCYAATQGYDSRLKGEAPQRGFLVGISESEFFEDGFCGREFLVRVTNGEPFDDFRFSSGEVWQDDRLLARITLKIWLDTGSA